MSKHFLYQAVEDLYILNLHLVHLWISHLWVTRIAIYLHLNDTRIGLHLDY